MPSPLDKGGNKLEPECEVIGKKLRTIGYHKPCRACIKGIPSYSRREGEARRPLGCLIAHTILSLLEALQLSKYFRLSVERLSKKYGVEGESWNIAISSVVLHDIGKLDNKYRMGDLKGFAHNVLSSLVVLEAFRNEAAAPLMAYALLLHHEAYHWKDVERFMRYTSLMETLPERLKVSVERGVVDPFREALSNILKEMGLNKVCDNVHKACETLTELSGQIVESRFKLRRCPKRYLIASLPLYRIIYIADNRAASARDGIQAYWLERAKRVDWLNYDEQLELVAKEFPKPFARSIALSALPGEAFESSMDVQRGRG